MLILRLIALLSVLTLAGLTYTYWEKRDNGRYVFIALQGSEHATASYTLVDSRTGTLYMFIDKQWAEIHPQTGAVSPIPLRNDR